jgi:phospholipid/cholesterol/gamma-HCH transport system permease protein
MSTPRISTAAWYIHTFAEGLGHVIVRALLTAGGLLKFQWEVARNMPTIFMNFHLVVEQVISLGVRAMGLVAISAIFTGGVAAYQMAFQFADLVPSMYVGMAVGKSVLVELGPILTGMVMVGQIGAAMCAELGHMAVNEQTSAMKVLNLNPYRYLLAPRLAASMLLLPVLNVISSYVAILSAYMVAWAFIDLSWDSYINGVRLFYADWDVIVSMIKSLVFGYILAFFACYFGYHAKNGADGVGEAIKSSVVFAMTAILIANFLISNYLL